ncbi:MAG: exodeoxyribonuclease VII small subunit [Spirochaetales bacterium]|nr:exodeoxyribonuclease VII small subunit [Spirochaetales bacterium]
MAKKKQSFEEALSRLEELQEQINGEEQSLENTMKLFEEALALTKTLEKELDRFETRIEVLTKEGSGDEECEFEDFQE